MNKSSRSVMTFSGGIHPVGDGKELTCKQAVRKAPLLEKYFVLLAENAGKPPIPVIFFFWQVPNGSLPIPLSFLTICERNS